MKNKTTVLAQEEKVAIDRTAQFAISVNYSINAQNTEKQTLEKRAVNVSICRNAIAIFLIH